MSFEVNAFEYFINKSKLPFSAAENITLFGVENLSINVTYGNYTSGLSNVNFTYNISTYEILVNVPNSLGYGNYNDTVHLEANMEGYSSDIYFYIHILNETPIENLTPTVEYIMVDFNERTYAICDYMLPWNRTVYNVSVAGRYNQTVYTDYDANFFSTQNSFVMPIQNQTLINIDIHLSKNLTKGYYTRAVKFSVIGLYDNMTFNFDILDCVQPPPSYNEYIQKCFSKPLSNMTTLEVTECADLRFKYEQDYYKSILEAAQPKYINTTVIEYVNHTERVPVLDLKDERTATALDDIAKLHTDINVLITENRQKQQDIDSKVAEVTRLTQNLEQSVKESDERAKKLVEPLTQENIVKQNTIDMMKEKYIKKSTLKLVLFLVGIGISGLLLFIFRQDLFWYPW